MSGIGAKILVADDDQFSRTLIGRHLAKFGFSDVTFVEDGAAALETIRAAPFDLLLLDMQMPVLSGIDVLRELKSDPDLRDIPVIVISGADELELVTECIEIGAVDYLDKPVNPGLLSARLRNVFEWQRLRKAEIATLEALKIEKWRADNLLQAILPPAAIQELISTGSVKARKHNDVVVMFADVVGFTRYCSDHPPEEVVSRLGALFGAFERIAGNYGLEKIKTVGDAFMAVASLNVPLTDPVRWAVNCGLDMMADTEEVCPGWQVRVGLAVGPVVAGVIGSEKFQYDVWGDTVNVAARMADVGRAGFVTLPQDCWADLEPHYVGTLLGAVDVKGKGRMRIVECSDVAAPFPREARSI